MFNTNDQSPSPQVERPTSPTPPTYKHEHLKVTKGALIFNDWEYQTDDIYYALKILATNNGNSEKKLRALEKLSTCAEYFQEENDSYSPLCCVIGQDDVTKHAHCFENIAAPVLIFDLKGESCKVKNLVADTIVILNGELTATNVYAQSHLVLLKSSLKAAYVMQPAKLTRYMSEVQCPHFHYADGKYLAYYRNGAYINFRKTSEVYFDLELSQENMPNLRCRGNVNSFTMNDNSDDLDEVLTAALTRYQIFRGDDSQIKASLIKALFCVPRAWHKYLKPPVEEFENVKEYNTFLASISVILGEESSPVPSSPVTSALFSSNEPAIYRDAFAKIDSDIMSALSVCKEACISIANDHCLNEQESEAFAKEISDHLDFEFMKELSASSDQQSLAREKFTSFVEQIINQRPTITIKDNRDLD